MGSLFLFFCICSFHSISQAEIYKWVDERGVIHFSDTPPNDKKVEILPEAPVNKIGGTEPTVHTGPSLSSSESMKEEEKSRIRRSIKYYQTKMDVSLENIKKYKSKISEWEDRKSMFLGYYKSFGKRSYYVIEDYDGKIRYYEEKIEDEQRNIIEYEHQIVELRNALEKLILGD